MKLLTRRQFHPAQVVILSFALVIAAGSALLSLPVATRSGERLPFVDALFTSVSATCVTGLAVVDTGETFSLFGQLVILACIQIGGLGLMTFTTMFVVASGRRLAVLDRAAMQQSFHHTPTHNIRNLIKLIVVATFALEALGALLLALHWHLTARFETFGETLYQAVFHSVSAFCNAGFTIFPGSLVSFQRDPFTLLVVTTLIIAGGLGFVVWSDVKEFVRQKITGKLRDGEGTAKFVRPRLSVHSKFVLITSSTLLAVGTISFYLLERHNLLAGLPAGASWMNAYFLAVTPRTAGFNSLDYAGADGASLLLTMVLMFIGASPGSTGGGIKVSTFGLLVCYAFARWRGHARLHAFRRTVSRESIDRAMTVVVAAVALVLIAAALLMVTETLGVAARDSQSRFLPLFFETVSAFGTVGLSLGETGRLTPAGKLIVAAVMFMGRAGPLTLALAIGFRESRAKFRYAEENVMVS